MRIIILAPYGALSQEAGVIYLLANYIKLYSSDIMQLTCNGVFSLCDRDQINSWKREVSSCLNCASDQRSLAAWGEIKEESLSKYVLPDEIEKTKRLILSLSSSSLLEARYEGVSLFELWQGSFMKRFDEVQPDLKNKHHENYIRRLMLSTLRIHHASKRFLDQHFPSTSFVAGGEDYITRSYIFQAKQKGLDIVRFSWDPGSRYVRIFHPQDGTMYPCEILLDSIASMRRDISTWPEELVLMLEDILSFLGMSETQLQLPMAQ